MTPTEWQHFLRQYSRDLIACEDIAADLPGEVIQSCWLGYAPATAEELAKAEHRLGITLPARLKSSYLVTNGWRTTGFFIWEILPVARLGWLRDLVPHLHELATKAEQARGPFEHDPKGEELSLYRFEQGTRVKRSLAMNLDGDAAYWLVDPATRNPAGEWAAGCWAARNPAMEWQAESFADLMQSEFELFRRLRDRAASSTNQSAQHQAVQIDWDKRFKTE